MAASGKNSTGPAPHVTSSPHVSFLDTFSSDINLKEQTGRPPRIPRQIIFAADGDLNVELENGDTVLLQGAHIGGLLLPWAPAKILTTSTTATWCYVAW